jgi:hypothetical protein
MSPESRAHYEKLLATGDQLERRHAAGILALESAGDPAPASVELPSWIKQAIDRVKYGTAEVIRPVDEAAVPDPPYRGCCG